MSSSSTPPLYRLLSHDFSATELKFTIEICNLKGSAKRPRPSTTDDISAFTPENELKDRFQLYKSRLNGTKFCEVISVSEIPLFHPSSDGQPCEFTLTPKQGTGQRTDINCACVIPSVKEWVRLKPSISQKQATLIFAYKLMDIVVETNRSPSHTPGLEELTQQITQLTPALTRLTEVMQANFLQLSSRLAVVEAKQNKIWETFQQLCQPSPTAETSSPSSSPRTSLTPTSYFHPHLSKQTRRY